MEQAHKDAVKDIGRLCFTAVTAMNKTMIAIYDLQRDLACKTCGGSGEISPKAPSGTGLIAENEEYPCPDCDS